MKYFTVLHVERGDEEYLTPAEMAEALDRHPATVTRWVRKGYVKARRMPGSRGRILIPRSELQRILGEAA